MALQMPSPPSHALALVLSSRLRQLEAVLRSFALAPPGPPRGHSVARHPQCTRPPPSAPSVVRLPRCPRASLS
eukprot:9803594-Alexandrium_andersonii.AAC.1